MNHDDLGNYSHTYVKGIKDSLAASQAREAKLREALIVSWSQAYINGIDTKKMAKEALSQPHDDTALRQYVAKELREMADESGQSWQPNDLRRRADELEGKCC